jgi:hypothetical protein
VTQASESISELLQPMLEKLDNVTAALIRAEIAESQEALNRLLAKLIVWLPQPEQTDLRRAFKEWFGNVLLPRRLPRTEIEAVHDLTEMQAMLAERMKTWTKVENKH